jgi:hypothetical protein
MLYNIAAFAKAKQLKVFTMMVFLEKMVSVVTGDTKLATKEVTMPSYITERQVKRQDCGHEQPGLFDTSVFKPGL